MCFHPSAGVTTVVTIGSEAIPSYFPVDSTGEFITMAEAAAMAERWENTPFPLAAATSPDENEGHKSNESHDEEEINEESDITEGDS